MACTASNRDCGKTPSKNKKKLNKFSVKERRLLMIKNMHIFVEKREILGFSYNF